MTGRANVAASVKQRLLNLAHQRGEEFNLVLVRYGIERFLYRLSQSGHGSDFVLKGAMLFHIWTRAPHRPTRDVDLLGRGTPDRARLEGVFRSVCATAVDEDGLDFLPESVRAERIRDDAEYEGIRVLLDARLGSARIRLQIDVGGAAGWECVAGTFVLTTKLGLGFFFTMRPAILLAGRRNQQCLLV